jgi:hypothetical protein
MGKSIIVLDRGCWGGSKIIEGEEGVRVATRTPFVHLLTIAQTVQQIGIGLEEYSGRGKDIFPVVTRPTRCVCSDGPVKFHQHLAYFRWVDGLVIWIAVYLCYACRCRTVSVLPHWALPYRQRSIGRIDAYFRTPQGKRREVAGHDGLRRSWYAWKRRWRMLLRIIGGTGCDPPSGWDAVGRWKGGHEAAQMELIVRFGESLLGTYRIHAWAK